MINPKFLYLCPKDAFISHLRKFSISNYIDLPNGNVLVSSEFHFEDEKDKFELHPQVQCICHDGVALTTEQAASLTSVLTPHFQAAKAVAPSIAAGLTAKQVRKMLQSIHPLM